MPGRLWKRCFAVASEQYGFVTAAGARDLGINPVELVKMARRGELERVAWGVYRIPGFPPTLLDELMLATLWAAGRGVLSHVTALQLHDLCDVNPDRIHLSVPVGYRPRRAGGERYVVHTRDLAAEDVTMHEGIPVVTAARAIEDAIAMHLSPHLVDQAVTTARARGLLTEAQQRDLRSRLLAPSH